MFKERATVVVVFVLVQYVVLALIVFSLERVIQLELRGVFFINSFILFYALSTVLRECVSVVFRMDDNFLCFVKFSTIFVFIEFGIKILYIFYFDPFTLNTYIFLISIVKIILFLSLFFRVYTCRIHAIKSDFITLEDVKFCVNWTLSSVIGKFTAYIDKPIVAANGSMELLGYYAIAQKIVSVLAQFRAMLKNLWIYEALKLYPGHESYTRKKMLWPLLIIAFISLTMIPFYTRLILNVELDKVMTFYLILMAVEFLWIYYHHVSLKPLKVRNSRYIPLVQTISSFIYLLTLYIVRDLGVYAVLLSLNLRLVMLISLQKYFDAKI